MTKPLKCPQMVSDGLSMFKTRYEGVPCGKPLAAGELCEEHIVAKLAAAEARADEAKADAERYLSDVRRLIEAWEAEEQARAQRLAIADRYSP